MPAQTPPKGRPTPGRVDRHAAVRRSQRRSNTKKVIWAVLAVVVLGAILVLGSGTGGNGAGTTTTNVVLPLLLLNRRALGPGPRR